MHSSQTLSHGRTDPVRLLLQSLCFLIFTTSFVSAETENAFAGFDQWWKNYAETSSSERTASLKEGIASARKRRDAMLVLMEENPKVALEKSFPEEFHDSLPTSIRPLVEVHVRGLASLTVTKNKDDQVQRRITMGDQKWKAYLQGRRLQLSSRKEIPIHGIVLEGRIAVSESPLERFPERETLLDVLRQGEGRKLSPIGGAPGTIPCAVGDALLWFDTEENISICEKALIEKEMSPEDV